MVQLTVNEVSPKLTLEQLGSRPVLNLTCYTRFAAG